jgi:sterol desaturase/sphingolipid hydroxylase (fatty acid hydroxylase superfamily)
MSKLLAFIGAMLGGWLGWWLGSLVGTMTAFFLGLLGTGVGMYVSHRITRHYLG